MNVTPQRAGLLCCYLSLSTNACNGAPPACRSAATTVRPVPPVNAVFASVSDTLALRAPAGVPAGTKRTEYVAGAFEKYADAVCDARFVASGVAVEWIPFLILGSSIHGNTVTPRKSEGILDHPRGQFRARR